jgi:glycosyltransferase involved in cell wall biosynthesis
MTATTSVAICSYNGSSYILEQLRSIELQSITPDEVIICDDASTDNTVEILTKYIKKTELPVQLIRNVEQLGSTKNFEKASSLCTSDIIFLSDQDDIWVSNKIEKFLRAFNQDAKVSYVFSNASLIDEKGGSIPGDLWKSVGFTKDMQMEYNNGNQLKLLLKRSFVTGGTMAFRKCLLIPILPFHYKWIHDYWITIFFALMQKKGVALNETLILYRQHPEQQIGLSLSFSDIFYKKIRKSNLNSLIEQLSGLKVLHRQFKLTNSNFGENLTLVKDKIEHLESRVNIISSSGYKKSALLIKEVMTQRYRKYTNGIYSIFTDIF